MPDPHGDAGVVQHLADVVGVDAVDHERHGAAAVHVLGRTDDPDAVDRGQLGQGQIHQVVLPGRDLIHAQLRQVVHCRTEPDGLTGHRHAGLEPGRRRSVGGPLHEDLLDHRAAGQERRHGPQQLETPVQATDPGRTEHLVTGERGEINVQRGQVHRQVRHRLAGVQHGERADRVGGVDDSADRVDGAEHVRLMGERNHSRAVGDQRVELGRGRAGSRRRPGSSAASHRCGGRVPATATGWRGAPSR